MAREGGLALLHGRVVLCALVAFAGFSACADDDDAARSTARGDDAVSVASFDFPESVLVAEIYSQALESRGVRVERSLGLGSREFVGPALATGLVELVPEYAGTALSFLSLGNVDPGSDPAQTAQALRRALDGTGVQALAGAEAQNANTFVVSRATAREYDLHTLSDLRSVASELTFGGPPECPVRRLCLAGLHDRYGLTFASVVTLDAGGAVTRQALDSRSVDVALLFSTDPSLSDYVELADDKQLQPAENVTPLISDDAVERWGADVVEPLEAVSQQLSTDDLRALNEANATEQADVTEIAADWLRAKGVT